MRQPYTPPTFAKQTFNCAHCHAFAYHSWFELHILVNSAWQALSVDKMSRLSRCAHCKESILWHEGKIIYPEVGHAEPANTDLPDDVRTDYDEAASIVNKSPRGAAALLRLAIQKLCKHLGQPGRHINDDIKALVAEGLPTGVQQALDSVRVIGNNAVHPGEIDIKDDHATAVTLFKLINFVAAKMITEPKEVSEFYSTLPEPARDAVDRRDQPKMS
ncbi:MAG: DUF4145 domain-containing protein [Burkholderiales bacterium]|nr:DUF4145 domain-containing protein [Phycisphaerae bacterium]